VRATPSVFIDWSSQKETKKRLDAKRRGAHAGDQLSDPMKKSSITNATRLAVAFLLPVSLVSAAGCARMMMTPGAQQVVTLTGVAARSCKQRGVVFALAPFSSPGQPLDQLKIRANKIGADTVVLLDQPGSQTKDWSARAYRCGAVRSRNPDATSLVTASR
jgi:hypothetical protein